MLDYFKRSYPAFPMGKALPSESPDFVIRMKNKNLLGLELTRLNPASALDPDAKGIREIQFREGFIALTKELFERDSELKLFVKFLFSENEKLTASRELSVAAILSNLIRKQVQGKKESSFFQVAVHKSNLPVGINELLIVHHPKLKTAIWERSNNLGISNNVIKDIRESIHKKDEKLRLYQKQHLNYYWLLITTDHLRGVKSFNLSNKIINHDFQSRFQQVFLFDLLKAKVVQLV